MIRGTDRRICFYIVGLVVCADLSMIILCGLLNFKCKACLSELRKNEKGKVFVVKIMLSFSYNILQPN